MEEEDVKHRLVMEKEHSSNMEEKDVKHKLVMEKEHSSNMEEEDVKHKLVKEKEHSSNMEEEDVKHRLAMEKEHSSNMEKEDVKYRLVMEKLKKSVSFRLRAIYPNISFDSEIPSIEDRLQQLFKSFRTPTHPPYALMIKRAIVALKEESGSTEEAISEFIKREYEDLPWAHTRILDVHLRKLCLAGEIMCTESGRYVLLVDFRDNVMKDKESGPSQRKKKNGGVDVSDDHDSSIITE